MSRPNLPRVRKMCLALPQATEVEAWGEPTFRIGKIFAMYAAANNHHGDGRESVWVKTDNLTQDLLIHAQPLRYFKPPYVGPYGWTGVYLDAKPDWEALADLLRDGYRSAAPKKLAAALDAAAAPGALAAKSAAKTARRPSARKVAKPARAKVAKKSARSSTKSRTRAKAKSKR